MFLDKIKARGGTNHVLIAAGLTVFAALCFAGLSAQVKFLTSDLHGFVITFWRNFWGLFFMLPWLFRQGLGELSWPRIRMFTLRSALSLASMLCGFTSLSYLTLANATALSFTAPLFATIMAALVLGETVRRRRWSATIVGFIGVLIVLRPGVTGLGIGEGLALAGAFLTALVIIVVKQMSRTDRQQVPSPRLTEVGQFVDPAVEAVMFGLKPPREAMREAAARINRVLSRP